MKSHEYLSRRVPIAELFRVRKNFDRVNPFLWISILSMLFIVLGLIGEGIGLLFWIGSFILLTFFLVIALWMKDKL